MPKIHLKSMKIRIILKTEKDKPTNGIRGFLCNSLVSATDSTTIQKNK
jgi:hypothetical protein